MTDVAPRLRAAFSLNFEQQKKRAKDLLREVKAGDPSAIRRLAAARLRASPPEALKTTAKLADAQYTIARELRFESWPRLKAHIALMDRQRELIEQKRPAPDAGIKTLHLRCGHDIQSRLVDAGFTGGGLPEAKHSRHAFPAPVSTTSS